MTPAYVASLRQETIVRIREVLTNPPDGLPEYKRQRLLLQLVEMGGSVTAADWEAR